MKTKMKRLLSLFLMAVMLFTAIMPTMATYNNGYAVHDQCAEIFELTNEARIQNGLKPLTYDLEMQEAANIRAEEISEKFSHTRPDGTKCSTAHENIDGENISWGYASVKAMFNGWMESTGHRANILYETYETITIGYFVKDGIPYYVQLFSFEEAEKPYLFGTEVEGDSTDNTEKVEYLDPITVKADVNTLGYLYINAKDTKNNPILNGNVIVTCDDKTFSVTDTGNGVYKTTEQVDLTKQYLVNVEGYSNTFYSKKVSMPAQITARLLKDGYNTGNTVKLSKENNWQATFDNLVDDGSNYTVEILSLKDFLTLVSYKDNTYTVQASAKSTSVNFYGKLLEQPITYTITSNDINTTGDLVVNVLNTENEPVEGNVELLFKDKVVSTQTLVNGTTTFTVALNKDYTVRLEGTELTADYNLIAIPENISVNLYKENDLLETVVLGFENDWTYTFEDLASVNYSMEFVENEFYNGEIEYKGATANVKLAVKTQTVDMVLDTVSDNGQWYPNGNPEEPDNIPVIDDTWIPKENVDTIPEEDQITSEEVIVEDVEISIGETIVIDPDNSEIISSEITSESTKDTTEELPSPEVEIPSVEEEVDPWTPNEPNSANPVLPEDEGNIEVEADSAEKEPLFTTTIKFNGTHYTVDSYTGTYSEVFAKALELIGHKDFEIKNKWGSVVYSWYKLTEDGICSLVEKDPEENHIVNTITFTLNNQTYTVECLTGTYQEVFNKVKEILGHSDFTIKNKWGSTVYSWYNVSESTTCSVSVVDSDETIEISVVSFTLNGKVYEVECLSGTYKEVFDKVKELLNGNAAFTIKNAWGSIVYSWYNVNEDGSCVITE